MSATEARGSAVVVGSFVRVTLGRDVRDGRVEHLSQDGRKAHVRLSPGWVHSEWVEHLKVLCGRSFGGTAERPCTLAVDARCPDCGAFHEVPEGS
jgi:hypothetical protein